MRSLILAVILIAGPVSGQTMFKCSNSGRIEYSDKPCPSGEVVKRIAPDGSPTPEERAKAKMRVNAERARFDAQDRAEALQRASQAEAADAARVQSEFDAVGAAATKQANEKVTIRGRDGWDRKPQAQVEAEQQARTQGRAAASRGASPPVASGASSIDPNAWQKEQVTAHDRTGWTTTTRGAQVKQEAEKAYAAQIAQQRAASAPQGPRMLTNCDQGGCWDTQGTRYNSGVGEVFFSGDGRTCNRAGPILNCN